MLILFNKPSIKVNKGVIWLIQKLLELTKQNNGIVTTTVVVEAGISRGTLKYLSDTGILEKVSRGVYILPGAWEDEFVNVQSRFKRGIFSLETALFYVAWQIELLKLFTWLSLKPIIFLGPKKKVLSAIVKKKLIITLALQIWKRLLATLLKNTALNAQSVTFWKKESYRYTNHYRCY